MVNRKLARRQFLHLAASVAAVPVVSHMARAQAYPSRPVRLILGYPAGAAVDTTARLYGQWLTQRLGQPFVIENRPGADSNIGTEAVVRAAPDGYTLLYVTATNAVNATLYDHLSFNFIRDIVPVAGLNRAPIAMEVHPSVPAATLGEFIAYARANPGKLNMGSQGIGSTAHVYGELFKFMAGVDMVHVPYHANPLPDFLAGRVQVMFNPLINTIEYIRSGKLRVLAVTTATRLDELPDIPTVGEFLPGYEATVWSGLGAPKDTPSEIINQLNKEIIAGLTDPTIRSRLADLGVTPMPMTPSEFGHLIANETEKWGKVIRAANIKPE